MINDEREEKYSNKFGFEAFVLTVIFCVVLIGYHRINGNFEVAIQFLLLFFVGGIYYLIRMTVAGVSTIRKINNRFLIFILIMSFLVWVLISILLGQVSFPIKFIEVGKLLVEYTIWSFLFIITSFFLDKISTKITDKKIR